MNGPNLTDSNFICSLENMRQCSINISLSISETFVSLIMNNLWLIIGYLIINNMNNSRITRNEAIIGNRKFFATFCFLTAVIIAPLLIGFLSIVAFYRIIVFIYLKIKLKDAFKGLLKGSDVMWAIENPEARSIINVLIILEMPISKFKCCSGDSSPEKELLQTVRNITDRSFLKPCSQFPKLKWLRQKCKLGYYYWINCTELAIEQFVRPLDDHNGRSDGLTNKQLELILGKHSNNPLPFNDSGTWEILVGLQHLQDYETKSKKEFPILIRIHHSVGDGVALLRLFLEALASSNDFKSLPTPLRKSTWSESDHPHFSTESSEFDDDDDCDIKDIHVFRHSSYAVRPVSYNGSSSKNLTIPQPITNDNQKNHINVNAGHKLRALMSKFRQKHFSPNHILTKKGLPFSKLKSFSLKEKPHSIDMHSQTPKQLTNQCSTERSEFRNDVPLRPRSVSPYATVTKEYFPLKSNRLTLLQRSPIFDKVLGCRSKNKEVQYKFDVRIEKNISLKTPLSPSMVLQSFGQFCHDINWKSALIYVIVIIIISIVCIQQTLSFYFKILYQKILTCSKFCFLTPSILFCQIFNDVENNVLYGEKLSGDKVLSWAVDDYILKNSFRSRVKQIRDHYGSATKFTHVLCACLSRSLHRYYLQRNAQVPAYINVVLPARTNIDELRAVCQTTTRWEVGSIRAKITRLYSTRNVPKKERCPIDLSFSTSTKSEINEKINKIHRTLSQAIPPVIELENKFTVGMMKLPVGSVALHDDMRLLEEIKYECFRLRNGPDYLVNYWLLRWFAYLVPNLLLEPILKVAPCTLVFSNLPGPEDIVHLAQIPVRDIVFWVPNRGLNGAGIGMLSYCGRFSTGIIIDKALIAHEDDAKVIVEGIYEEAKKFLDNKLIIRNIKKL